MSRGSMNGSGPAATVVAAAAATPGTASPAGTRGRYTLPMRAMHWTTAAAMLGGYAAVWAIGSASTGAQADWLAMLHRSFGITILALTPVRLAWRLRTGVPPLPAGLPAVQRLGARASVVVLYALLILQPALGLAGSMLHGDRITVFGDIVLPGLLPVSRPLARQVFQAHGWIAMLLLALVVLHVAAALHHHLIRRDEVLSGMLPGGRRLVRPVRPDPAEPS